MAAQEKYRIGCLQGADVGWITSFDEVGVFSISQNARDAAEFDSFDKVHHAKAFLEACNPLVYFDLSRHISIPCHVASRPVAAQRSIDG